MRGAEFCCFAFTFNTLLFFFFSLLGIPNIEASPPPCPLFGKILHMMYCIRSLRKHGIYGLNDGRHLIENLFFLVKIYTEVFHFYRQLLPEDIYVSKAPLPLNRSLRKNILDKRGRGNVRYDNARYVHMY